MQLFAKKDISCARGLLGSGKNREKSFQQEIRINVKVANTKQSAREIAHKEVSNFISF